MVESDETEEELLDAKNFQAPKFDTAIGAQMRKASAQLQRNVLAAVELAVRGWADQMGITAEKWLDMFEPDVKIEPGEGARLNITITAKIRKGAFPFELTVVA